MAYSTLSTYPLILFGIIEPALLIWAFVIGLADPVRYFSDQNPSQNLTPATTSATIDFSPEAEILTLQFINALLLLAAMALICCWTTNATTTKWYLVSVAVADLGHIYAVYQGLGAEGFRDWRGWNDMVAANVGVSLFLHVNRWATVAGVFGKLGSEEKVKVK